MATISDQHISASGRLRWTDMTVTGRVNWDPTTESHLNGGILIVLFRGEDPGPDESRHAIGTWISRGTTHASSDEYWFEAHRVAYYVSQFTMVVENTRLDIGGVRKRRYNEDVGRDEIYAEISLQNISGTPAYLAPAVRTSTVTGWF